MTGTHGCPSPRDCTHHPPLHQAGIPLLLVATKHDLLQGATPPEVQDVVGRALRALAHTHAATLVVLGEQGPVRKGGRGERLRSLLRGHLFHGWDVDLRCVCG